MLVNLYIDTFIYGFISAYIYAYIITNLYYCLKNRVKNYIWNRIANIQYDRNNETSILEKNPITLLYYDINENLFTILDNYITL